MYDVDVAGRRHYSWHIVLLLAPLPWGTVTGAAFLHYHTSFQGLTPICEKALPGGNSTPRRNLTWFRSLSSGICFSKIKDLGKRVKRRSECVEPVTHRLSPFRKPEKRCCLPYSLWEVQTCLASPGSFVTDESTVTQAELSGSHLPWLCRQGRTQVCRKLGIMADTSVK